MIRQFLRRLTGASLVLTGTFFALGSGWVMIAPTPLLIGAGSGPDDFLGVSSRPLLLAMILAGGLAFNTGAKLLAETANEVLAKDGRFPVVLLRSFKDDELQVKTERTGPEILVSYLTMSRWRNTTFEELLTSIFSELGPVIAVGQPGRALQPLGAARALLADDIWRAEVKRWLGRSQYVIVVLGRTTGLLWELKAIVDVDIPEKLVVALPPLGQSEIRERWAILRDLLNEAGKSCLPDSPADSSAALRFRRDWSCYFVHCSERTAAGYRYSFAAAFPGVRLDEAVGKRPLLNWLILLAIVIVLGLVFRVIFAE